jgi:hypothetical protein
MPLDLQRDEAERFLKLLAGEHAWLPEDQWNAIHALVVGLATSRRKNHILEDPTSGWPAAGNKKARLGLVPRRAFYGLEVRLLSTSPSPFRY